jgi:hypothetical protein
MIRAPRFRVGMAIVLIAIGLPASARPSPAADSPPQEEKELPGVAAAASTGPSPAPAQPSPEKKDAPKTADDKSSTVSDPLYRYLWSEDPTGTSDYVIRFGYWGSHTAGSPVKVGEYQGLGSSPFFDVDGIRSDGNKTLDYTVTGTDTETTDARFNYYQPGFGANVDYQRYPRRLEHNPLNQFTDVFDKNKPADFNVVKQDMNVGQDYAIRVQQLKASFKGRLTDNVKVRLDLWGMD